MKYLVVLFLFLSAGCATAPATFEFDPTANVEGDYDQVWSSVVEYFVLGDLPIKMIEKDSGLIVTEWMDAGSVSAAGEDKTYCDCGGSGMSTQVWTRGKFSVFAKKIPGGGVDLRVTCTYQQQRYFMDSYTLVDCNSTGKQESLVHEYVKAKAAGSHLPTIPQFKPGDEE